MKKNRLSLFRPKNWAIWTIRTDIVNYFEWINTVKREKANRRSLWHQFGMKHNIFYTIYFPLTLPDEDKALPDNIKRLRVVEKLSPVHRYIDEELNFAEYIVPEFNQFFEDEQPTLKYGIVYRFAFQRLSLGWLLSRTIIIGGLTFVFIKYPIITIIAEWITSM